MQVTFSSIKSMYKELEMKKKRSKIMHKHK